MTGPVSGSDGTPPYSYTSNSSKKVQNPEEMIMEIENTLQQKLHHGQISAQEFNTLSQRLEGIQEQYQGSEVKEYKANSQTVTALNQLKSDIDSISGGGSGGKATGH